MHIHTSKKLYACSVCAKTFAEARYVTRHALVHTGEKLYFQKVHLQRHTHVHHTGEKP